jgi:hypothetical protein
MTILKPRYSKEEFARRGTELYEQVVRPTVGPADKGKYAAIDIESREFEIHKDDYSAIENLLRRLPDAQIWLHRVGAETTRRIGRTCQIFEFSSPRRIAIDAAIAAHV